MGFEKDDGGDLERTDSQDVSVTVTLQDVYEGTTKTHPKTRRVVCRSCRLQPNLPRCKRCRRCPGERKQRQRWIDSMRYTVEEYEEPSQDFCEDEKFELTVN